jgi:hypothetical protein
MNEDYGETEAKIAMACQKSLASKNPFIAAIAQEFEVSKTHVRSRWKECQAKIERPPVSWKLIPEESVALHQSKTIRSNMDNS